MRRAARWIIDHIRRFPTTYRHAPSWYRRMMRWLITVNFFLFFVLLWAWVPEPWDLLIPGALLFIFVADLVGFPVIPRRWRRRQTSKGQPPTFLQAAAILSRASEVIEKAERADITPITDDDWHAHARWLEQFAWHLRNRGMLGTARTAYDLAARARAIAERLTADDDPTPPTVPAGDGPPPASPPTR